MPATSSLLGRDVSADGNVAIFMGSLDCLPLNMEALGSFEESGRRTLEVPVPSSPCNCHPFVPSKYSVPRSSQFLSAQHLPVMWHETWCINKHFIITTQSLFKKIPRTAAAAATAAANLIPASVQVLPPTATKMSNLLHNDRVLRQLLPSGKRMNNYQSVVFIAIE